VEADGGLAHNGTTLRIINRRMEVELEDVGRETHLEDGKDDEKRLHGVQKRVYMCADDDEQEREGVMSR
jgi:hypothetical protein